MKIKEILQSLSENGFNDYRIAAFLSRNGNKTSASIIYRLRTGVHKKTSYERGKLIERLYHESNDMDKAVNE